MDITLILTYTLVGLFAGLLAGILGAGGGVLIVPVLQLVFHHHGVPLTHAMHMAIGTSLAFMIVNSTYAASRHFKRQKIALREFKPLGLGLALGSLVGAYLAGLLKGTQLRELFAIFTLFSALYVLFQLYQLVSPLRAVKPQKTKPKSIFDYGVGIFIGGISTILGIGGSILNVPYILWKGYSMRYAIGIASACTPIIAVVGTVMYIFTGLQTSALPSYTFGYVYIPALLGLLFAGIPASYFGVKISHSLPLIWLKSAYVLMLFSISYKMFH